MAQPFMLRPEKAGKIRHDFATFIYFPIVHDLTYFTKKNTFKKKYSVKKCI